MWKEQVWNQEARRRRHSGDSTPGLRARQVCPPIILILDQCNILTQPPQLQVVNNDCQYTAGIAYLIPSDLTLVMVLSARGWKQLHVLYPSCQIS